MFNDYIFEPGGHACKQTSHTFIYFRNISLLMVTNGHQAASEWTESSSQPYSNSPHYVILNCLLYTKTGYSKTV